MKQQHQPMIHPYLALLLGVLSVSTSAIFAKLASAPAPITATYRMLFTVLFMVPFLNRSVFYELVSLKRKDWGYGLLSGIFLAFHFILWFESLRLTSVASSVVLVSLQPLFSFIGGYFIFKERLSIAAVAGGLIAFLGSGLIGWGDFRIGGTALLGDVLALIAAGMVTGYWLIGQYLRKSLTLFTYTFVVYGMATLVLFLYDFIFSYSLYPYPTMDWIWFVSLALIPTLLGHTVFNWVIRWLNASVISMSILGEPIGASILAYFLLGESIQTEQWIGGTIILLGIYLFMRYKEKRD